MSIKDELGGTLLKIAKLRHVKPTIIRGVEKKKKEGIIHETAASKIHVGIQGQRVATFLLRRKSVHTNPNRFNYNVPRNLKRALCCSHEER